MNIGLAVILSSTPLSVGGDHCALERRDALRGLGRDRGHPGRRRRRQRADGPARLQRGRAARRSALGARPREAHYAGPPRVHHTPPKGNTAE